MGCICSSFCKLFRQKDRANSTQSETKNYKQNAKFLSELPQVLHPGHLVVISGTPEADSLRFAINFLCGKVQDPDIAFHFNPRFDQNYVVRNTRTHGSWGTEETTAPYILKLPRCEKFKLEILFTEKEFIVHLNNIPFCTYKYRMAISKIKCLEIIGDVDIHEVDTRDVTEFPLYSRETLLEVPCGVTPVPLDSLPNPYTGRLNEILQVGQQVEILGRVKLLPCMFYVNLQEGHLTWPHPLIPIHINPRFNTSVGAYSLVRNSWYDGRWGPEERTAGFTLQAGKNFHMAIRCEIDYFELWVDYKMAGLFQFRTPTHEIDTVYIQGDIVIFSVFVSDRNLLHHNNTMRRHRY